MDVVPEARGCLPRFDLDTDRVDCGHRLAVFFRRLEAPLTNCFQDVRHERIVLAANDAKVTHVTACGDYAFEKDYCPRTTDLP